MKKILLLIGIILMVACQKEEAPKEPEIDPIADCRIETLGDYSEERSNPKTGLIEGDIIPDKPSFQKAYINASKSERGDLRLWPNNIVPFYFTSDMSENKKAHIRSRMAFTQTKTNLIFIEFSGEKSLLNSYENGIKISPPLNPFAGNSSHVGMQGGIQNLTLTENSTHLVVDHEIFHSVNHEHEHNRPDRDEHITMLWDNIPVNPLLRRQFDKGKETDCIRAYGEYDYKSGMHYGSKNGASNAALREGKVAFTDKNGKRIDTPTEMSELDYEANRMLYPEL